MGERNIETILIDLFSKRNDFKELFDIGLEYLDDDVFDLNYKKHSLIKKFNPDLEGLFYTFTGFDYNLHPTFKKVQPDSVIYISDGKIKFVQSIIDDEEGKDLIETYLHDDIKTNIYYQILSNYYDEEKRYPIISFPIAYYKDHIDLPNKNENDEFYIEEEEDFSSDESLDNIVFGENRFFNGPYFELSEDEYAVFQSFDQTVVRKINEYLTLEVYTEDAEYFHIKLINNLGLELGKNFNVSSNVEYEFDFIIEYDWFKDLSKLFNEGNHKEFLRRCFNYVQDEVNIKNYNNKSNKYKSKKVNLNQAIKIMNL